MTINNPAQEDANAMPEAFITDLRQNILKEVVRSAVVGVFILIGMYFTLRSLGDRVSAIEVREDLYVRKDVLQPQIDSLQRDIKDLKDSSDKNEMKLDRILEKIIK